MRVHPRTQKVELARPKIALALIRLQQEHDLTMVEMLQAINAWQATELKYMLRRERHPDDPGKGADEE